ncbi:MAG: flagellar biosynthetic protein FliR, partial [Candidatus Baltobacteraceae bacterium]
PAVPAPARVAFALALTAVLLPAVTREPQVDGVRFVIAAATELGIGAAIGTAASVLYDGAYAGGRALDDYAGIRGSVPNAQVYAASAFGRIWSTVFLAGFFLLGGYRVVIEAFARSFDRLPPGAIPAVGGLYAFAIALPAAIVETALLVAGPAIAVVFAAQFALAAIARVIPRFAAFTLSFPVIFGLALTATALAAPVLFPVSGSPWLRLPFLNVH